MKAMNEIQDKKVYCDECKHYELRDRCVHKCFHRNKAPQLFYTRDKYDGMMCTDANPDGECDLFEAADGHDNGGPGDGN